MKRTSLSLIGAILVATGVVVGAQQRPPRDQRGGPAGVFKTEVPDYALSVVQFEPTSSSVGLSLLSPRNVEVGISSEGKPSQTHVELVANIPQNVRISGLVEPSRYRITGSGVDVSGFVKPIPSKQESFVFDVQADSHLDENSSLSVYTDALKNMAKDSPAFVIDLGDTFMTEKRADFRQALAQYAAQHYYMGLVDAPWYLVLGNHDGEQGWIERRQPDIAPWASAQRRLFFPPPEIGGNYTGNTSKANYYAFSRGDALVVVLDPFTQTAQKPNQPGSNWNMTLGNAQYRWLAQTLKESRAKYKFVFVHNMVGGYSKDARGGAEASVFYEWGGKNEDGSDGFAQNRPGWEMPIHDLLVKNKVSAVFHGHDHFYARQERDGVTYLLVPQPSIARSNAYTDADRFGYKSGKILPGSGYVRVSVKPEGAKAEFVQTGAGSPVADSTTISGR